MAEACKHEYTSKVWPSRMLAECDKCGEQQPLRRRKPRIHLLRGHPADPIEVDVENLPEVNVVPYDGEIEVV